MCGIAGIVSADPEDAAWRVNQALDVQRHRGPDDRGVWTAPGIVLGQLRLSILDLTDAGHQPMAMDGGRLAVVFNGEIFNYKEIRQQLIALGRTFKSTGDTEVVLQAYDEWGPACASRFNGMWAIAIYDRDRQELWCSRDRFGVKPFYYAMHDGRFVFASEIKGVLAADASLAQVDEAYLARFLTTARADDTAETFFRDIRALEPGHSMSIAVSPNPRILKSWRYWQFDFRHSREAYDFTDPEGQLLELLSDSVRLRLRADVPVGTCLSGGLDSSSIVALASRAINGPVWTFSALYDFPAYDESRYVDMVNGAFNTVPRRVHPTAGDLLDVMPRIAWHQDEPSAGPGLYSQWHVMEAASRDVKVLLDGQGADEALGGYRLYFEDFVRSAVGSFLTHPTATRFSKTVKELAKVREHLGGRVARIALSTIVPEWAKRALRGDRQVGTTELSSEYRAAHRPDRWDVEVTGPFDDRLSNVLYDAVFRSSLPALLRYEDRNSMAFSIEARTPFLDYRLIEFSLALPYQERIDGAWTKSVLRRSMAGILPDEITWRRDKLGYPTPFAEWLRTEFRCDAESVVFDPSFKNRGIFDMSFVEQCWRDHLDGSADHSWNIWRWLSVEFWFRAFIDRGGVR